MEHIVANRVNGLPADAVSEVFDRLIWCMVDNGEEIGQVRREWFHSDDKYKVEVALNMNEVYPFPTRAEMESHFTRIASCWPDLNDKCEHWLAKWDEQFL
ncbi:hypothetical protein [Janthinobacterium fluminis]|uniref:Uncharacterized protein n=1 Tax=Janthinobacterium fluminis TaxID=2987524 RepID=A0ABT5JTF7_9BURK|nr:hypothetical protein [Janthinobacterium fluminis]MDC8756038.1 hypothetical protein [Janthinobacterium fluminis]